VGVATAKPYDRRPFSGDKRQAGRGAVDPSSAWAQAKRDPSSGQRAALCRDDNGNFEDEKMKKSGTSQGQAATELISKRIAELGDWRGKTLSRMRRLIKEADPDAVEEWKWRGTPVWSHDGILCTGESYKKVVKLTFAKGASLKDPARLFNSSLEGNVRRAIDIHEGEEVDESAFKALVRQAAALNSSGKSKAAKKAKS
jgi:hypothetical protein